MGADIDIDLTQRVKELNKGNEDFAPGVESFLREKEDYDELRKIARFTHNPIEYVKNLNNYISDDMVGKVLQFLPVDIKIDGKEPKDSPIAVLACFAGILQICPYEKEGVITDINPNPYGAPDFGFVRYMDFNGIPSLHMTYKPKDCGIEDFSTTYEPNQHLQDLLLEIRTTYCPDIFE